MQDKQGTILGLLQDFYTPGYTVMPFVVKLKTFLSSVSVMKKQGHGLSLWLLALVTGDM